MGKTQLTKQKSHDHLHDSIPRINLTWFKPRQSLSSKHYLQVSPDCPNLFQLVHIQEKVANLGESPHQGFIVLHSSCSVHQDNINTLLPGWIPNNKQLGFVTIKQFTIEFSGKQTGCEDDFACLVWLSRWNPVQNVFPTCENQLSSCWNPRVCESKTTVISLANHKGHKQSNEPIQTRSKHV